MTVLTEIWTAPISFIARASSSLSSLSTLYTPSSPECERPLCARRVEHAVRMESVLDAVYHRCAEV